MSPVQAKPTLLQTGIVSRIDRGAGFGYVQDKVGKNQYIFVFGDVIKRSQTKDLNVGKPVEFRVSGNGRIDELLLK